MGQKISEEYLEYAKSYIPQPQRYTPYQSNWKPPEEEPPIIIATKLESSPFEPRNFSEFIGQASVKEVLQIIVDSANKERRLIPNILLTGAYGHGKTTLAKLIIKRHRKKIRIVDGSIVETVIVPSTDVIYIVDEAHNIPSQVADTYNILIDSGNLRIIACTTNPGALPAAFRSRFRNIYISSYTVDNIKTIIQKAANRAKINLTPKAAGLLAARSKLNPRYGLTLLDFIREISILTATPNLPIIEQNILEGVRKLGIDSLGLTEIDRKYLSLLKANKPIGLQYIASVLAVDVNTIQEEIEPYLIQLGLIERTQRGRIIGDNHSITMLNKRILEEARKLTP